MNVSRTGKLVAGIICIVLVAEGQRLAWAITATAQHAPLKTSIGLPINFAYQPDYYVVMDPTGTIGLGLQPYASLGGTFLSLQCNGQGTLNFNNNPGAATLSLSASSGTATMNLGLLAGLNVEFLAFGDTISGSLFPDLMPDWGFYDNKSFSSYLLNGPVTLSSTYSHNLVSINTLDALTVWFGFVIPDWLAGINFNVNADVTISQTIWGQSVSTSAGSITSEGQSLSTYVSGSTYQLQSVQETWQDTAALTLGLGADLSADLLWGAVSVSLVDFGSVPLITVSRTYQLTSEAIPTVQFSLLAQTPTAITLSCALSPSSATPGAPITVSGSATYNNGAGPVPSATVTIVVDGATYTAAVSNGQYSRSVYAPASPGSYQVSVTAADGAGRSGSSSSTLTVTANGGTSGYTINQFLTCESVNSSSPYDYSGSIDAFGSDDARFYVWTELLNVYGGHSYEVRLYRPDGSYYNSGTSSIPDPSTQGYAYWSWYREYTSWSISGYDIASTEGQWTIKLLIDGVYKQSIAWTMRYNFNEHLMAQDVQSSSPYNPINPRNIFRQTDAKALTWGQALKVSNPLQVQWTFYEPSGSQYSTTTYSVPNPDLSGYDYWGWYDFWGWIGVQGNAAASKCGNWRVNVSIQDVTGSWDDVYMDYFSIIEDPPQAPEGSVSAVPAFPTASQTIALNLSCSDNTYLQRVVLYWNDGSLHSNVWDNIVSSSYSQSKTIGPYGNGTQIQYWAVVTDTSGNASETSHQVVAVAPPCGSLQVTIAPTAASSAGAQWQVDGGGWQSNGSTVTLAVGSHSLHFSGVLGWNTPSDQTVTINNGQTTTATGTYTAQTGALTVTINPPGVGPGAQWQVDGGALHTNGNTVTLLVGSHIVHFNMVAGWTSPGDQVVSINPTLTTSLTGSYVPTRIIGLSGNLEFGGVTLGTNAQRTLTIANNGNATLTVSNITYPTGFSGAWSGTIPPNNSQPVTVTFAPALATAYAGNVIVNSDATGGNDTLQVSGTGMSVVLTVNGLTANNKVYDGTTSATLNTASATLNGVLPADAGNVTLVTGGATGTFADKNVGTSKPVTISGLTLSGSAAGNYALTQPTATASITALGLTVAGVTAANKVYDGTTSATLNTASATLNGVLAVDAGNVTLVTGGATGTFADRAVGMAKLVTTSGLTLSGSAGANYALTQPTTTASITALGLTVGGVTAANKVYDGTASATVNTGGATLNGVLPGDAGNVTLVTSGATGTFADRAVGMAKLVTISGLTLSGSAAGNYALTQPTTTASITALGLTVGGVTAANKVYDGTASATVNTSGATLNGVLAVDGGNVSLVTSGATGTFADKGVGIGKTVSITGLTLAGTAAGNYALTQPTLTATITPANPVVTTWPTASAITYGQSLAASTFSGGSATPAGTFTFTTPWTAPNAGTALQSVTYTPTDTADWNTASSTVSVTVNKADPSVTAWPVATAITYGQSLAASTLSGGSATPAGTFAFTTPWTAPNAGTALQSVTYTPTDTADYNTSSSTVSVTVNPKALTVTGITANDKVYDGNTTATLNTSGAILLGIVSPDVVTLNTALATGAFTNPDVGTAKTVLVSGLTLSGAVAGNYMLTQSATTASITPAALAVAGIEAQNKVYDGTNSATLIVSNAVLLGVLGGDTVTLDTTNAVGVFADKNVGAGKAVSVSGLTLLGADAAKYALTQPTTNADITAASLTVTGVTANDKVYDGTTSATLDTNSAALEGVISGDDVTLDLTAAAGAFAAPNAGPGKTVLASGLTLSGTDAGNYALTQPTLTATITPADPVVTTWPTASAITYGQSLPASTLSGGSATPAGTFAFTTPWTAPNAGIALQSVTYTPTDTADYNTASSTVSVTVNKADPVVTTWPTASAITYGQSLAACTLSGGSATPAGSFAFTTPSTAPSAGTALQSVTYTPTDIADYNTASSMVSVTVNKANPVVTSWPTASAITYGQSLAASTLGGGSASPAGTFAFTTPSTAPNAGTALQSVTYTPTDTADYNTANSTASVTVNPKALTVAGITANNKVYDGSKTATLNTTNAQLSGVLSADTGNVTLVTSAVTATFSDPSVGTNKLVTISGLALSGSAAGNYILIQPTTTADIIANARLIIESPSLDGHSFRASVTTLLGPTYILEYRNLLTETDWQTAATAPGTGGTIILTDPAATNSARFYRIRFE